MNEVYLTAMAALAGSAVGALASFGTTWLTQNAQERARRFAESMSRKKHLYGEFIEHASKLYVDAQPTNRTSLQSLSIVTLCFVS